jgi:hypothetical protein
MAGLEPAASVLEIEVTLIYDTFLIFLQGATGEHRSEEIALGFEPTS